MQKERRERVALDGELQRRVDRGREETRFRLKICEERGKSEEERMIGTYILPSEQVTGEAWLFFLGHATVNHQTESGRERSILSVSSYLLNARGEEEEETR